MSIEQARTAVEEAITRVEMARHPETKEVLDCCLEYARQCCCPAELAPRLLRTEEATRHLSFYKFLEIQQHINVDSVTRSAHLCEAPGSFIDACLYRYGRDLDWYGITRRGWAFFDRHLRARRPNYRNRVSVGEDGSGDLLKRENARRFIQDVGPGTLDLVTADAMLRDGAPEIILCAQLHCALTLLREGGALVIRVSITKREPLIRMLLRVASTFGEMELFRPEAARDESDELYMICSHYQPDPILATRLGVVAYRDEADPGDSGEPLSNEDVVRWLVKTSEVCRSLETRIKDASALAAFFESISLLDKEAIGHHIRDHYMTNPFIRSATEAYLGRIGWDGTLPNPIVHPAQ